MAKERNTKTKAQAREDRLKAALKVNLSRRKVQAKQRNSSDADKNDNKDT